MMNRIISIVVTLLLSFAAAAFGGDITIGVSLSLTGKYTEMGNMQQKGFLL